MAGTIEHLVIADRLLDVLPVNNPALFYCGNLAPDAIMGRENYVREMKNHTHFKDGLKPFEFRIKENQDAYRYRLQAFTDFFFTPEYEEQRDLYLGYLVHILVDELYLLEYYEDFVKALYEEGKTPEDADFCKAFVSDVDQVDWELVRTYRFRHPMPEILLEEDDYEIPGWITNRELCGSKRFIIYKNFESEHEKLPLKVTTMQKNLDFLDLCVAKIPGILHERYENAVLTDAHLGQ